MNYENESGRIKKIFESRKSDLRGKIVTKIEGNNVSLL